MSTRPRHPLIRIPVPSLLLSLVSTLILAVVLPLLFIFASAAQATVLAPEVLIRADTPSMSLKDDAEFVIPVMVYLRDGVELRTARVSSDTKAAAPQLVEVSSANKGVDGQALSKWGYRVVHYELRGALAAGLNEVRIAVETNDQTHEDVLHLREFGGLPAQLTEVDPNQITGYRFDPERFTLPDPVSAGGAKPEAASFKAPRDVRVHGRLTMQVPGVAGYPGVHGATVILMQQRDILDDIEIEMAPTDVNGNFDFTGSVDGAQNLYVKFRAINSIANIGTDAGFQTYSRNTTVRENFTGTEIFLGATRFRDDMNTALFILTTLTRAHAWYESKGFVLSQVNCRYFDDILGSSCYLPVWEMEGMHIRPEDGFDSRTVVHEYGHHFVHDTPAQEVFPPDYSNSNCGLTHCGWCSENEAVAWSEGFPYFLTSLINADHVTQYSWTPPGGDALERYESHTNCRETDALDTDPPSAELFFAAFLNDLIDLTEDSSAIDPGVTEYSELTLTDIFNVGVYDGPSSSLQFLEEMRNYVRYSLAYGPDELQEFWAAARINGFESDLVPPLPPTSVTSSTHTLGVSSNSNMPELSFSGASDEDSGVYAHYVTMNESGQYPGGGGVSFTEDTDRWPTPLAPGTWYANVVSVDRAGNQSATQFSYGPMIVGEPAPLDLTPVTDFLWDSELIVRHDATVTATEGYLPSELVGDTPFWISFFARNVSVAGATVDTFVTRVFADGSSYNPPQIFPSGIMAAGQDYQLLNYGAITLPGGRHRIYAEVDHSGKVPELDNTNNGFGAQWVFRPALLPAGDWQAMPSGPLPDAGDSQVPSVIPNSAGRRVVPANDFAVVMLRASTRFGDYQLRLHPPSSGPFSGFDTVLASSSGSPSAYRTLVLNSSAAGHASFDAGTVRDSDRVPGGYELRHISSELLLPGDGSYAFWSEDDHLSIYEFTFNVLELGPFSATIDATFEPGEENPELELFWIDRLTAAVDLESTVAGATSDSNGHAVLDVSIPSAGNYALVVRREARVGGTHLPVEFNLETTTVPQPDLEILRDNAFWDAPMLPSFEILPGPKLSIPLDLIGEGLSTYLNFGIANTGLVSTAFTPVQVTLDGVQNVIYGNFDQLQGQDFFTIYGSDPFQVRGGRHTLSLIVDPLNQIAESDENNNIYATQFGWSGSTLNIGGSLQRVVPPDADAGLDLIEMVTRDNVGPDGEASTLEALTFIAPNSDGFRLPEIAPKQGGMWVGVATVPGDTSNVDLRLHEVTTPAAAFTTALVSSSWGVEETDFVVVNHHETPAREFDVGVINAGGENEYTVQSAQSIDLGLATNQTAYGPFIIDDDQIFTLLEFWFEPSIYDITLHSVGAADLGFTLLGPSAILGEPYHSKDDAMEHAPSAWLEPPGLPEFMSKKVEYGEEGSYCLVVWKRGQAGLPYAEDFTVEFALTPVPYPHVLLDGSLDQSYGPPFAVQSIGTAFGDSDAGLIDEANGSELDGAYASIHDGVLYLLLTGNLESNYNDLEIFLDTGPGGQNELRSDNSSVGGDGLNRMGGDDFNHGLRFDTLFEPDHWFSVQGGTGVVGTSLPGPYKFTAYWAELQDGGGGAGAFLGATQAGSNGRLIGQSAVNPHDVRVTIDNRNVGGVSAGTGADSGLNAYQGIEFAIPLSAIGNPTGCIRVCAFINGQLHDYVSNQVLPSLPVGTNNLAEPRDVDFSTIAGNQFFEICPPGAVDVEDGRPPHAGSAFALHAPYPNPFNPRTSISFTLPADAQVTLEVYDVAGRKVATLAESESMRAGTHTRVWEARDSRGSTVASGTYLVRMRAGSFSAVKRLTLLK